MSKLNETFKIGAFRAASTSLLGAFGPIAASMVGDIKDENKRAEAYRQLIIEFIADYSEYLGTMTERELIPLLGRAREIMEAQQRAEDLGAFHDPAAEADVRFDEEHGGGHDNE